MVLQSSSRKVVSSDSGVEQDGAKDEAAFTLKTKIITVLLLMAFIH